MIKDKIEIQKVQQPFEQKNDTLISVDSIGRKQKPLSQRQITDGIVVLSDKVTADAPYTNDWYIDVIIKWKKVRLMTTA